MIVHGHALGGGYYQPQPQTQSGPVSPVLKIQAFHEINRQSYSLNQKDIIKRGNGTTTMYIISDMFSPTTS